MYGHLSRRQRIRAVAVLGLAGIAALVLARAREERRRREEEEERERNRRMRRPRRWWVRPWIGRRQDLGAYDRLLLELQNEDVASFTNFLRMSPEVFEEILNTIRHRIETQDTMWRKAIPAGMKLAVTLRYMASGDSYKSLAYTFRVPQNTMSLFIPQVTEAIIAEYGHLILYPLTTEGWKKVAKEFEVRWNFPHCCGALDGKHVAIKKPGQTGSLYYNYKHFFSIVLMALVDANYRFIYVEAGFNGASSDGGVFDMTELKDVLEDGSIDFPEPCPLPGGDRDVPYFIVADDAFALKTWLMKPLPQRQMTKEQRIYNYRLSRARRVVENAFGVLAARFRCMLTTMGQKPKTVTSIVLAACCLHNFLINHRLATGVGRITVDQEDPDTHEVIPGNWREIGDLPDLGGEMRGNYGTRDARAQRSYLVDYVNSEAGSVPWQEERI